MKIVVAEDETEIRELIKFKLESAGFEVHAEADGESALRTARRVLPDVIVVDWMMPRMNGIELCQAVRADASLTGTAVLLLTAKGQERDVQRGFAAGVDDYMVKPFSPRELVTRVEAVASRARSR